MSGNLPAKIDRNALAVEQARYFQTISKHRKADSAMRFLD